MKCGVWDDGRALRAPCPVRFYLFIRIGRIM